MSTCTVVQIYREQVNPEMWCVKMPNGEERADSLEHAFMVAARVAAIEAATIASISGRASTRYVKNSDDHFAVYIDSGVPRKVADTEWLERRIADRDAYLAEMRAKRVAI